MLSFDATAIDNGKHLAQWMSQSSPDACLLQGIAQFARCQSIIAVQQVDQERKRFSVTLKPALVASPDAALLASLFSDLELASSLRCAAALLHVATSLHGTFL